MDLLLELIQNNLYKEGNEMQQQIRLKLEYHCYPIWIYDSEGKFIDNDLVDEITNDAELYGLLEELQSNFDSLYLNNNIEFKYIGFNNDADRQMFQQKIEKTYEKLSNVLNDKYEIINAINVDEL